MPKCWSPIWWLVFLHLSRTPIYYAFIKTLRKEHLMAAGYLVSRWVIVQLCKFLIIIYIYMCPNLIFTCKLHSVFKPLNNLKYIFVLYMCCIVFQNVFFSLGDSGYPCLPWLFTPISYCTTLAHLRYNWAHSRTWIVIEQTFGVLKSHFCCISLSSGFLRYALDNVMDMFLECCILHNMLGTLVCCRTSIWRKWRMMTKFLPQRCLWIPMATNAIRS